MKWGKGRGGGSRWKVWNEKNREKVDQDKKLKESRLRQGKFYEWNKVKSRSIRKAYFLVHKGICNGMLN